MSTTKPNETAEIQPGEEPEGTEVAETVEEEDYAGYGSLEKLKEATFASRREGKRLASRTAELEAKVAELSRKPTSNSALDRIAALGLPKEDFEEAVAELVDARVDAKLAASNAPKNATDEAVLDLRSESAEFRKFEGDFNIWLQENPEVVADYREAVADAPKHAKRLMKGMFAEFAEEARAKHKAKGESKKVSADAKLTGGATNGGARKSTSPARTKEELAEILADAKRTGNKAGILKAVYDQLGVKSHPDIERLKNQR